MDANNTFPGIVLMSTGYARDNRAVTRLNNKGKPAQYAVKLDGQTLDIVAGHVAKSFPNGIKLKDTHDGTATEYLGVITNVRRDGNNLLGDLEVNPFYEGTDSFRWALQKVGDHFGVSAGGLNTGLPKEKLGNIYDISGNDALLRPSGIEHFAVEDECASTDSMYPAEAASFSKIRKEFYSSVDNANLTMSKPALPSDKAADTLPYEEMATRLSKLETMFAAFAAIPEQMAKFAAMGDDYAKFKADCGKVMAKFAADPANDEDGDAAKMSSGIAAITKSIGELSAKIVTPEKIKEIAEEVQANFASKRLGMDFRRVPAPNPADAAPAGAPTPYMQLCQEAVDAKKFPDLARAMTGLRRMHPDSAAAYFAASRQSLTPDLDANLAATA